MMLNSSCRENSDIGNRIVGVGWIGDVGAVVID